MKIARKYFLLTLVALALVFPRGVEAFSFGQVLAPASSLLVAVGEKVQYFLAFTPANKVKVLESQAQKRLTVAQTSQDQAKELIGEYQSLKTKQNTLLNLVDSNTLAQVRDQTLVEQEVLATIGNEQPQLAQTVQIANTSVVAEVKATITYKEGTTAGEAFGQKATITYAPGTSGQGTATVLVVGGEQKYAPGTSGGGAAKNDTGTNVVVGGGGTAKNETSTTVDPGGGGGAGGAGGTTVVGSNESAAGETSGGNGTQTVVSQ
jgi:hypothetical protein